jgi:hypothetical protein
MRGADPSRETIASRRWLAWLEARLAQLGIPSDARLVWFTPSASQRTMHVCVSWTDESGVERHETADVEPLRPGHWPGWAAYRAGARLLRTLT